MAGSGTRVTAGFSSLGVLNAQDPASRAEHRDGERFLLY